ncbi:MAG: bacteriohemerythrin [Methylococcales bacterium]|nr:bacteriohemerythrin [Methylococcales bacterium]MDD5753573.1 bacteriohemerythrin [Methylococcales bacterium]
MNETDFHMTNDIDIFPWNKNFDTGIEIIDEQHKKLLELVNLLAKHFVHQSDTLTLNTIFKQLTDYTIYHFQTEEAIWHEFFPGDELEIKHKATHSNFIAEISRLKNEEGDVSTEQVIEDVLSFLTQWLAFHILDNDKRMAKTIKSMQNGATLEEAKHLSEYEMTGAMKVLIETVLSMYDSICSRTVQLMKEILERQKIEVKQRLSSSVFENTLDAICITDKNLNIIEANPSFCRAKQLSSDDLIGLNLADIKIAFKNESLLEIIRRELEQCGYWSGEIHAQITGNERNEEWLTLSSVKNELGGVTNYVAVFSNVANLLELKNELEHHAYHDALTGLPNRILLADRLKLALAHTERNKTYLAICYLDLDGFKAVNDTLGHAAGDELLKEVARRFSKLLRANDTVARFGGDEFVILFGDLHKPDDYQGLLDRLLSSVKQPIQIGDEEAHVSASIGVTLYPLDKSLPEVLLEHADLAMYHAKQTGKSKYVRFDMNSML